MSKVLKSFSGIRPEAMRHYIERLADAGWQVSLTHGNHVRLDPPDGGGPVFTSLTSSDRRSVYSLMSMCRRRGAPR